MSAAPFLIVGVLSLCLGIGIALSGNKEPEPKANELRAVKMSDGTYRLQYYWPYPGWTNMHIEYPTEDRAREALAALSSPNAPRPQVAEVLK